MSHRTIFSLAAGRYWENWKTELLAFFLDPKNEHQQGARFFHCLLRAAGLPLALFVDVKRVTSQLHLANTTTGVPGADQAIDLCVETAGRMVVIRNKASPAVNDSLPDYPQFARLEAARTGSDPPATLLILGMRKDDAQQASERGWTFICYEDFARQLRADLDRSVLHRKTSPRWSVLTREFIDHLGLESSGPHEGTRDRP